MSSTEAGIHLDGLCTAPDNSSTGVGNTVSGNKISVACVGILSGPPQGSNTIGANTFSGVTTQIQYGSDSASCGPHHMARRKAPRPHKGGGMPAAVKPA